MYEGHSALQVVEPVLLMGRLGARTIVLTNAAGGVNPAFGAGTLMVIADHLNLTGRTPLLGPNDDSIGPRFPDLTDAWDPSSGHALHAAGKAAGVSLAEGIYAGLIGPAYETPAEVRMLRHPRRGRRGHVHRHGGDRGPLGGPAGLRRLPGHESRRRASQTIR